MQKKLVLISLSFLICSAALLAQGDSLPNRVTFQPFYFTMKGLRLSYDRQVKPHHWIEFSPLFYLAEKSGEFDNYTSLKGTGSMVYYKYYVSSKTPNSGTYIACGAMFNYFWIEYPRYTSISNPSTMEQENLKTDFGKFGGDIIVGYDFLFASGKLTGGVYAGLGYRYTNTNNKAMLNRFNGFYWDYAYSGNIMLLGLRLGLAF